jgi:hypothetical protein
MNSKLRLRITVSKIRPESFKSLLMLKRVRLLIHAMLLR